MANTNHAIKAMALRGFFAMHVTQVEFDGKVLDDFEDGWDELDDRAKACYMMIAQTIDEGWPKRKGKDG